MDDREYLKKQYDQYIRYWIRYVCWKGMGFHYRSKQDKKRMIGCQAGAEAYIEILRKEEEDA